MEGAGHPGDDGLDRAAMRRILYVDPAPFAGGAQQSLRTLVESLNPEEFRPLAAGSDVLRDILPSVPWLPLDLPPLRLSNWKASAAFRFLFQSFAAAATLRAAIRLFDVAIVHANGRGAFLPALIACKNSGIPMVWHARDLLGPLLFDRVAARCSDICIVPSLAMAQRLTNTQHSPQPSTHPFSNAEPPTLDTQHRPHPQPLSQEQERQNKQPSPPNPLSQEQERGSLHPSIHPSIHPFRRRGGRRYLPTTQPPNHPSIHPPIHPLFHPSKIRIIPNGVDTERFRPLDQVGARTMLGLPPDRFIVGNVGQWVPWKRVDLFLEAARIAYAQNPRLYFILCGGPPPGEGASLAQEYSRRLAGMGTILPWTGEVPLVMAALDVIAHPAEQEAFGRSVVEAMSCGRAVIGAAGGGVAETIMDGSTGLLFPPGNVAALAAQIVTLSQNPERTAAMGLAGRRRAEAFYTAQQHTDRVQEVYRGLIG